MAKLTTEEFIQRARKVHGDKYDYSKVEYVNNHTKVCIICPEHGEFYQAPTDHLRGHGCSKCAHINTANQLRKYDTYESCKKCASQCTHRADFQKKFMTASRWARKNGWMDDFFPINRKDKKAKIHTVYCFIFKSTNSVYVGRSVEPLKREKAHHKSGPVYLHSIQNDIKIPKMKFLYEELTLDESRLKEEEMVSHFKKLGYNILNKARVGIKSGAIGAIGFGKLTKEYCFQKAKECKTRSGLEEKYQSVYLKSLKNGWLEDYFWFKMLIKPKGFWDTFENTEAEAKKYKSRRQFEKGSRSAYNAAIRNGWMDILFPQK